MITFSYGNQSYVIKPSIGMNEEELPTNYKNKETDILLNIGDAIYSLFETTKQGAGLNV